MVLVHLHQLWYSAVEIKKGSFHQNERLFAVEKANFHAMSAIQGGNDTASDVYSYSNEIKHD